MEKYGSVPAAVISMVITTTQDVLKIGFSALGAWRHITCHVQNKTALLMMTKHLIVKTAFVNTACINWTGCGRCTVWLFLEIRHSAYFLDDSLNALCIDWIGLIRQNALVVSLKNLIVKFNMFLLKHLSLNIKKYFTRPNRLYFIHIETSLSVYLNPAAHTLGLIPVSLSGLLHAVTNATWFAIRLVLCYINYLFTYIIYLGSYSTLGENPVTSGVNLATWTNLPHHKGQFWPMIKINNEKNP